MKQGRRKRIRKVIYSLPVILGLGIIPLFFFIGFKNRYILRNYGVYTSGIIAGEGSDYRGQVVIIYKFYIGGEKYINRIPYQNLHRNSDIMGRSFPIVYYPKSPGINKILITPGDFKYCNRPYPDSLHWVLDYIEK